MIKALLVDDEQRALDMLRLKLQKHFPEIHIEAEFTNPQEAIHAINTQQPDLVFLDITMPVLSGFDVLSQVEDPSFEIIFVTAYNDYAIEAINHAAMGYIVKPIDSDELIKVVNRAIKNIEEKQSIDKNTLLLSHLMAQKQTAKIAVPLQKGIRFLKLNDIVRFSGVDGYTQILMADNTSLLSSYSIGKFSKMVEGKGFFNCHKSHLVNLKHVDGILNNGMIEMTGGVIPCSKTKKTELLRLVQEG